MTYADKHYDWSGIIFIVEKAEVGSELASWDHWEFYGPFVGVDYLSYWMRFQDFWDKEKDMLKDGRRYSTARLRAPVPLPAPEDMPDELPGPISRDCIFPPEKMYFDYWTYPPRLEYEKENGPTGQVQKRADHIEAE